MSKKVQGALYALLNKRNLPDEELNRYVLMLAVAIIAGAVHAVFLFFFLFVRTPPLAVSHAAGFGVFCLTIVMLNRRKYDLAGLLLSIMIMFSSLATIYTIGGSNFSVLYQFVVLLMQMVVPFANRKIPIAFSIALPLIMVGSYLFDMGHTPPYDIGTANTLLAVMNLAITSTGVILLMSLERVARGIIQDFHQKKMRELQDQAYLDPLTELFNRRYANNFFARLSDGTQERNICVAIVDIDDFKLVNDGYGHDAGDAVLRELSDVFNRNTRKSDLVVRWGGEEFLLILQNATLADAQRVLNNIREKVSAHTFQHNEYALHITITAGVAALDVSDIAQSIAACDKKLYAGKQNGKNQVVV